MDRTTVAQAAARNRSANRSACRAGSAPAAIPRGASASSNSTTAPAWATSRSSPTARLPNYESEIKKLNVGCQRHHRGRGPQIARQGPGDRGARRPSVIVHGWCRRRGVSAPEEGALVRVPAHHRPPAAAHQHLRRHRPRAQLRQQVDPRVLPGTGLPLHPHADHHAPAIAKGPASCSASRRSTPPSRRCWKGKIDYTQDFFGKPAYLTVSGQLQGGDLRLRARQGLHLRPDVPRRELQHVAAPRRVLDDRAGDGVLRSGRQHDPGRGVPQAHHHRRARTSAART